MMDQRDAPIMASDECTQPKVRLQLINEKARRHTPRPSLSGTKLSGHSPNPTLKYFVDKSR